jgi:hypothetical protein
MVKDKEVKSKIYKAVKGKDGKCVLVKKDRPKRRVIKKVPKSQLFQVLSKRPTKVSQPQPVPIITPQQKAVQRELEIARFNALEKEKKKEEEKTRLEKIDRLRRQIAHTGNRLDTADVPVRSPLPPPPKPSKPMPEPEPAPETREFGTSPEKQKPFTAKDFSGLSKSVAKKAYNENKDKSIRRIQNKIKEARQSMTFYVNQIASTLDTDINREKINEFKQKGSNEKSTLSALEVLLKEKQQALANKDPDEEAPEPPPPYEEAESTIEQTHKELTGVDIDTGEMTGEGNGQIEGGMYSDEIEDVMKMRSFKGAIAADEIPSLPSNKVMNFIINKDKRGQAGSHWCAVFIDSLIDKNCCYYDPLGNPPSKEVERDLRDLVKRINPKYKLKFKINTMKNQRDDTDTCAWQCIRFIRDMSKGDTFKKATGFCAKHNGDNSNHFEEKSVKLANRFGWI